MLSRYLDYNIAPLVLRIGFGGTMLIAHGIPKLTEFAAKSQSFPDPLGITPKLSLTLTVFSEVICSLLIILGVKVRLTTIPLIITMAVAAFVVHAGHPWAKQELSVMYLFAFTALLFSGGGKFSIKN